MKEQNRWGALMKECAKLTETELVVLYHVYRVEKHLPLSYHHWIQSDWYPRDSFEEHIGEGGLAGDGCLLDLCVTPLPQKEPLLP